MMGYANMKYRTEKRKANVGERILITDADFTFGDYDNGDVFTVTEFHNEDSVLVTNDNDFPQIYTKEYEVIIEAKPSKNERITLLESQVADLTAKVEALEHAKAVVDVGISTSEFSDKLAKALTSFTEFIPKPTPNEQRKAVIERAKAFVLKNTAKKGIAGYKTGVNIKSYVCDVQFIVNTEKRVVTLLAKGVTTGKLRAKAIAKCAPDDVFNADIGKAIALGRALGLDVSEFENAPKPTELVSGMIYGFHRGSALFRADNTTNKYAFAVDTNIIDDTEAQY